MLNLDEQESNPCIYSRPEHVRSTWKHKTHFNLSKRETNDSLLFQATRKGHSYKRGSPLTPAILIPSNWPSWSSLFKISLDSRSLLKLVMRGSRFFSLSVVSPVHWYTYSSSNCGHNSGIWSHSTGIVWAYLKRNFIIFGSWEIKKKSNYSGANVAAIKSEMSELGFSFQQRGPVPQTDVSLELGDHWEVRLGRPVDRYVRYHVSRIPRRWNET